MKGILSWLEDAEREIMQGEYEAFKNSLKEADYLFYAQSEVSEVEREAMGLLADAKHSEEQDMYDRALIYLTMAIDVLTLPEEGDYQINQVGMDTAEHAIDMLMETEIEPEDEIANIQWHFDMRRLENTLLTLMVEDHKRRFSKK